MITSQEITRIFRHQGTDYPDPLPGQPAEKCLEVLAVSNPKLNNARLEGPELENGQHVYTLKVAVGTKG